MLLKPLREMTIKDTFMFYAVMNDEDTCRRLLERVLGMCIDEVTLYREESLFYHPQFHGVRLDVIAVENGTRRKFNVEMQVKRKGHLGKRSRYYHSQIDMDMLQKGIDYDELPDAFVIFICDFDPFGLGLYRYDFTMQCKERALGLDDGSKTIFLNTAGNNASEISPELVDFLDYLSDPKGYDRTGDLLIDRISSQIEQIKVDRNWGERYMLLTETLKEERAEGRAEGRGEGRAEGRAEGRTAAFRELVEMKMKKNYDVNTIAEQLELPAEFVQNLYDEIRSENQD